MLNSNIYICIINKNKKIENNKYIYDLIDKYEDNILLYIGSEKNSLLGKFVQNIAL